MEETSTPWAVAESALAHNLGNSTEIAYARSDLFAKCRLLMEQWDNFLFIEVKRGKDQTNSRG